LSAKESLVGHALIELLGNILIGFEAQLLDKLVRRGGIENVCLDRYILVVKLVEKSERRDIV
jgi:hypothetical protein